MLFLLSAGLSLAAVLSIHPFLAESDSRPGGALVVEGWAADYILTQTIEEYERGGYQALYVTGGPLEQGSPLIKYNTVAEVGAATLKAMRPDLRELHAVPAPLVRSDRTYASAIALKQHLTINGRPLTPLNLISGGTHARRSRMLFREAFGPEVEIGIISFPERSYEPKRWWTSSQGFRSVTSELIAYVYARFFFRAPEQP